MSDKIVSWTAPPPPHHIAFKALPDNLVLTQIDEIWKTTSIFLKMHDDFNFFQLGDNLNFILGNLGRKMEFF